MLGHRHNKHLGLCIGTSIVRFIVRYDSIYLMLFETEISLFAVTGYVCAIIQGLYDISAIVHAICVS